jgi:adenylate kinase family enzyme
MKPSDAVARIVAARRILVLGSSGSGKTTFARELGGILNIDPVHLDAHFWKTGWIPTPQPEWRQIVSGLIERSAWIMDGTYESTLDLRIPAADCIIEIEGSRRTCLWRALKRRLTINDRQRPDAPPGQKLDRAFLRYIWQYPGVTRPVVQDRIRQYGADKPLVRLRGSAQATTLLDQLRLATATP